MYSSLFHTAPVRPAKAHDPQIAVRIAQVWLTLGVVGVLCVPALRGTNEWIGALPFWLIVMPLANLLILRWRNVLATSRTTLATLRRRRVTSQQSPSRRAKKPRVARRSRAQSQLGSLLTAFLN